MTRIGLSAATCLLAALIAAGCSPCTDIHLQYIPSPDKRVAVEVIERHCGKPADFAQRLVIRRDGWRRWFSRVVEVFALDGPQSVVAKWGTDSRMLEVWYSGGTILHQETRWGEVEIRYHLPTPQLGSSSAGAVDQ